MLPYNKPSIYSGDNPTYRAINPVQSEAIREFAQVCRVPSDILYQWISRAAKPTLPEMALAHKQSKMDLSDVGHRRLTDDEIGGKRTVTLAGVLGLSSKG